MRSERDEHEASGEGWELRVSEAVDGAASPVRLDELLQRARQDPSVMATWHCYQVIGDVLRSDELAGGGRDRVFLAQFRERLVREPVLLAPEPAPPRARMPGRRAGVAAAALVAVSVALVSGYLGFGPDASGPGLAVAPSVGTQVAERDAVAGPEADALQVVVTPNGQMLRDAALDQYLQAHRQFGSSSALQMPAGFVRGATADLPR